MIRRSLPALALLLCAAPALADPTLECPGASQVETGACLTGVLARVNEALDLALGYAASAASELDGEMGTTRSHDALLAAQAAWEAYRTAHCEHVGTTWGGGSGTGIAMTACHITLGRARVDSLLALAG